MSETQEEDGLLPASEFVDPPEVVAPPAPAVPYEPAIPLRTFAEMLRPRAAQRYPNGQVQKFDPGHPDEIWLKVLKINHGSERHTRAEWFALIDSHRDRPAHSADPRYKRESR